MVLAGAAVYEAGLYNDRIALPSAVPVGRTLTPFAVDPTWVRSGAPNFRGTAISQSPDGKTSAGLWACDGPSTFEWSFGSDDTVHLLEGKIEVDYRGRHFTLNPGDTATFHYGTSAVWHVPKYAKKVLGVQEPGRLVRLWRKVFRIGARSLLMTALHAAPVLPADFKQRVRDLAERAAAHRLHQHIEHVGVRDHGVFQTLKHGW